MGSVTKLVRCLPHFFLMNNASIEAMAGSTKHMPVSLLCTERCELAVGGEVPDARVVRHYRINRSRMLNLVCRMHLLLTKRRTKLPKVIHINLVTIFSIFDNTVTI